MGDALGFTPFRAENRNNKPEMHPVSHADEHQGTRRDFIYYATAGAGAVVTGAAVWPLVNQMNPSADVLALASIRVDISAVDPGTQITVLWQGKPVFIRNRTEEEIAEHVQIALNNAASMLDSVEPQAEAVDRRAADFARRSFARFRYLQEVSSGRRAEVRELFEHVNERYAECKLNSLPESLELPSLKIPAVSMLAGTDSLFIPRNIRIKGEQQALDDFYDDDDSNFALDEMSDNINSSLTTLRANRFFRELNVDVNGLESKDLPTDVDQWLLNTVGLLLHGDTLESEYDITTPRDETAHDLLPEPSPVDDMLLDTFTIHPKAR